MMQPEIQKASSRRRLLAGLALLVCAQPAWAIFGVWRRAARRTVIVAGAATTAAVAGASYNEAAAAQSAQAAANASAAAANQAAASAQQAEASAAAAQTKTPQQKLKELQSLYDQHLISESDYEEAKKKQQVLPVIQQHQADSLIEKWLPCPGRQYV